MALNADSLATEILSALNNTNQFDTNQMDFGRTKIFIETLAECIVVHIQKNARTTSSNRVE